MQKAMSKSILQEYKHCWFCGSVINLHEHHIFGNTANRKLSEKYGLKVYICAFHHNLGGKNCVHQNKEMDRQLKVLAQTKFEEVYPELDFKTIFGRNYI